MSLKKSLVTLVLTGFLAAAPALSQYNARKKICVVPGHDGRKSSNPAQGKAGKENEIALRVALRLEKRLKEDGYFVLKTRTSDKYALPLVNTIRKNFTELKYTLFKEPEKLKFSENIPYPIILKGIVKHVNNNNFDAVINIHFNAPDNSERNQLSGFCVYWSSANLKSNQSSDMANFVCKYLQKDFKPSNNKLESKGTAECSKWVLLGNNCNDLNYRLMVPSVLIECGYINEKQFRKKERLDKLAFDISEGIRSYFEARDYSLKSD